MDSKKSFWEKVQATKDRVLQGWGTTFRAKVPTGWLVRHETFQGEGKSASTLCFCPDHKHDWEIAPDTNWEVCHRSRSPNDNQVTCRLKVPGGWIVRDGYYVKWKHLSLDLIYVPDPSHSWSIS